MIRENLKQVEPRSLGLILLMLSLLIVAAMALYLMRPQYQRFSENSASLEMLNGQIDDQTQLQRAIEDERKQIQDLQLQLHGEAGDIPFNEMEAYLIGRLQSLAWEAGIELVGVRPGPAKRIMEFEELSFKVEVSGEYRNLYVWLDSIGDKLGFMLVSNYDISLASAKANETQLNMNVTIVFYRAADK